MTTAVEEFQLLEVKRSDLQIAFALVYVIAALLLPLFNDVAGKEIGLQLQANGLLVEIGLFAPLVDLL